MNRFTATALLLTTLFPHTASAQQQGQVYTVILTPQEVILVARGLGELPYKDSYALMQNLTGQIDRTNAERAKLNEQPKDEGKPATDQPKAEKP